MATRQANIERNKIRRRSAILMSLILHLIIATIYIFLPSQEAAKDTDNIAVEWVKDVPKPQFRQSKVKPPLKAKGVSIIITADNVSPPKINVQTYGNQKHVHHHHHEKPVRIPKTTEEPEMKIHRSQNKQIITLNLPDVKNLEDIEIKQLHQSIEIKAFAGDKAYFKLIPIPSNASVNNEFKDGVLKIEVVK